MNFRKLAARCLAATVVAGGITVAAASPAMAAQTTYPLYDASGAQRTTMWYEDSNHYLMACYPSDFSLVIEEKLDNGTTVPRAVEQFQCNVAFPFAGGKVVAVRGIVDGFENPWQPVG